MLYRFAVQQKTTYVKSQRYILIDEIKNKAFYGISYNKTAGAQYKALCDARYGLTLCKSNTLPGAMQGIQDHC